MILVAREKEAFTASALRFTTVVFCSVLTALFVAGEVCIPGAGYFLLDREMNGNENRTMSTFVLMYKSLHSSTAIINGKVVTGKFRVLGTSKAEVRLQLLFRNLLHGGCFQKIIQLLTVVKTFSLKDVLA